MVYVGLDVHRKRTQVAIVQDDGKEILNRNVAREWQGGLCSRLQTLRVHTMAAMRSSQDEREALADFAERYTLPAADVVQEVERKVIGAVWGANGYTTVSQADVLAERLNLTPGKRLLDIGTGRGWPGIYLAKRTGCEVVLTDLPIEGLRHALHRSAAESVSSLGAVVASARYSPFADESVDAIVHTDVLC